MKKTFVHFLNAFVYIDELGNPEEYDRIKIWDSKQEYLDYFPIETLISASEECGRTLKEEYNIRCQAIENASDINELISLASTDEYIIAPISSMRPIWAELLASDAFTEDDIDTALNWSIGEQIEYLQRLYVNFIGNFALLNKDAR